MFHTTDYFEQHSAEHLSIRGPAKQSLRVGVHKLQYFLVFFLVEDDHAFQEQESYFMHVWGLETELWFPLEVRELVDQLKDLETELHVVHVKHFLVELQLQFFHFLGQF
jgi:hypothetical protein